MITWGSGVFLFGVLGVLIPIIIHLLSKKAAKIVEFGSIRFLTATRTKTMKSLQPSQWWLLLLRCVMITILAIVLSQPFLATDREKKDVGYLIDPSLKEEQWFDAMIDTLPKDRSYWLGIDYPLITDPVPVGIEANFFDVMQVVPDPTIASWHVVSPLHQSSFDGPIRSFPQAYEWVQPPMNPKKVVAYGYEKGGEDFELEATFDEWNSSFESKEGADVYDEALVNVLLHVDEPFQELSRIFELALATLENVIHLTIQKVPSPEMADWVIWLSEEVPPQRRGLIALDHDTFHRWKIVSNNYILVADDLSEKESIQMNLPLKLLRVMADKEAVENDLLTVDPKRFEYRHGSAVESASEAIASGYFWLLLLIVLVVERWLSLKSMSS